VLSGIARARGAGAGKRGFDGLFEKRRSSFFQKAIVVRGKAIVVRAEGNFGSGERQLWLGQMQLSFGRKAIVVGAKGNCGLGERQLWFGGKAIVVWPEVSGRGGLSGRWLRAL
jgi:hypothetical protein